MQQYWKCGQCRSLNDATAKQCYRCHARRSVSEEVDTTGSLVAPGRAATPLRDPSLLGALLIGLAAAAASTAVWYWFDAYAGLGYFKLSWLVGVSIGAAVTIGGRGRTSLPSVILSVLLTIAALTVGEYLLISHGLALVFSSHPDALVLAEPQKVLELLPAILTEVPLRPVLWIVAIVAAFVGPWSRLVGPSPTRGS
jgi:hypothetical protein